MPVYIHLTITESDSLPVSSSSHMLVDVVKELPQDLKGLSNNIKNVNFIMI